MGLTWVLDICVGLRFLFIFCSLDLLKCCIRLAVSALLAIVLGLWPSDVPRTLYIVIVGLDLSIGLCPCWPVGLPPSLLYSGWVSTSKNTHFLFFFIN